MKILLFAALFAAASAIKLGSERCTWGPAFWCDNALNAKACGTQAITYCIQNEWSKITVKDDTACSDCKAAVLELKNLLNNATIQKEILDALKNVCSKLGSEALECKTAVDLLGKEVLKQIVNDLDPVKVCALLDLCKNSTSMKLPTKAVATKPNVYASICTDCMQIVSAVQDLMYNQTFQMYVETALTTVCTEYLHLPAELCSYIKIDGSEVFQIIAEALDATSVCNELGICDSKFGLTFQKRVSSVNADPCTDCKQVFSDLQDILSNKTVQAYVVKQLEAECEMLGLGKDICEEISTFAPEIFTYLISLLDGEQDCTYLGLCSNGNPVGLKDIRMALRKTPQLSAALCTDCKEIFSDAQNIFSNPQVQLRMLNVVMQVCRVTGPYKTMCESYVQMYSPAMITLLLEHVDPASLCQSLDACNNNGGALFVSIPVAAKVSFQVPRPNGGICDECNKILKDLDEILSDPTVQIKLLNTAISICEALGIQPSDCSTAVNSFGPEIIDEITKELGGGTICSSLGLCTAKGIHLLKHIMSSFIQMQQDASNDDTCSECKEMLADLDDVLNNKTVQSNLFKTLISLCDALGVPATECSSYINTYGPMVVGLITSELDPITVCNDLQLCPASIQAIQQAVIVPANAVSSPDGDVCVECKEMFTDLVSVLNDPSFQTNLFNVLVSLCEALGIDSGSCSSSIYGSGPEILEKIISHLDSNTLCAELGLCTSTGVDLMRKLSLSLSMMQQGVVNADTCSDCKEFVTDLDDILNNQTVQANLFKTLIAVCESLGISSSDCSMYINQYGPVVIGLITSNLDPNTVCNAIQVCPSTSIQPVHQILIIPVKLVQLQRASANADVCSECKEMVMDFISILSNQTVQKNLFKTLEALCQALGISASDCSMYINEFAPVVINAITSNLDPSSACAALGLCPMFRLTLQQSLIEAPVQIPALHMTPALLVKPKNDLSSKLECKLCNLIMSKLDSTLAKDSTQAEIEKDLYAVCSILPPKLKTKCTNFVKQDIAVLIDAIVAIGPGGVCYAILSCDPVMEAPPAVLPKPVPPKVGSSAECMVCQEVLKEVESELSQNATEAEIQKFLDMVCNKIPLSSLAKDCGEFVDDYTDAVILLLLAEADPLKVCSLIGVCTQSEPAFSVATIANGSLCVVCDVVFGIIEVQLELNNTLEEVNAMIEKVCPLLPNPLDKQCLSFLNLYGPMLLKLIVDSELAPYDVCKDLRLCSASSKVHLPVIKSTEECTICKELIEYLQKYLEGANKTLFLDELEKICNLLPTADQQTCKNDIDVFGSYIIDIILSEITPSEVCAEIGVCTNSTQVLAMDPCKIGPTFWCSNPQNAKLCNAVEHCRRHVWN